MRCRTGRPGAALRCERGMGRPESASESFMHELSGRGVAAAGPGHGRAAVQRDRRVPLFCSIPTSRPAGPSGRRNRHVQVMGFPSPGPGRPGRKKEQAKVLPKPGREQS